MAKSFLAGKWHKQSARARWRVSPFQKCSSRSTGGPGVSTCTLDCVSSSLHRLATAAMVSRRPKRSETLIIIEQEPELRVFAFLSLYVYTSRIYTNRGHMGTARVFRSGNSQAVRLPKQFRLKSKEVEIFRRGDEIVLREKKGDMVRAFELLAGMPDDLKLPGREKDRPQKRKGL
jgi:antitoxin VapB